MELRMAKTTDLPQLVEIVVGSTPDDVTYQYEWPRRLEYPEVMRSIWESKLEGLFSECRVIEKNGNVIAFAIWSQESHAKQLDVWPPEDLIEKFELVGSRARSDVLENASRSIRNNIKNAGIQQWFTMHLLVTDRPFRRLGAAAMLLEDNLGPFVLSGSMAQASGPPPPPPPPPPPSPLPPPPPSPPPPPPRNDKDDLSFMQTLEESQRKDMGF
ncbi:hypothetical protein GGTG_13318 [Gaeumannomyces tritici R3-111a-1]|uniref:N-acetyltransferase domain-containing protein n=1 Tax=Gaeumannomyces tritici (strain R3-111a-1) TaxID=644352 RepID=J3PIJ0_GAET3|nr:hypothetical protein GGTG_13318 [Gaeumannomyces tritici R3-111a-1]EJT69209.1 hypothetical protein GGTG_13318 [Gaeumannomyces tritici R3-111a-1]